jgi:large subunit ribosomal protein L17
MRHRVAYRKLGRVTEHRIAMLRNQAVSLLRHERIRTTVPRAKELRPFVERLITVAKRGLEAPEGSSRGVTARRTVARDIADRAVVRKLFDTIAPRYAERPGGYTRILRVGVRRGDAAEMAELELIGSEYDPRAVEGAAAAGAAEPEKKTMGGRLRRALGGRRKAAASEAAGADDKAAKGKTGDDGGRKAKSGKKAKGDKKARTDTHAKGASRVSTPRKAGGS